MPYPTAILFTLALLTVVMALIGWSQDPSAPAIGEWVVTKVTEGGLWSGLLLFLVAVGYYTWREARTRRR